MNECEKINTQENIATSQYYASTVNQKFFYLLSCTQDEPKETMNFHTSISIDLSIVTSAAAWKLSIC